MMRAVILFQLLLIFSVQPYKVLLYSPNFSRSHINFIGKLADLYVNAGHYAVVFRPLLFDDDPNLLVNGTKARVIIMPKTFNCSFSSNLVRNNAWTMGTGNMFDMFKVGYKMMKAYGDANTELCKTLFSRINLTNYILASSSPLPLFTSGLFGIPYSLSHVPSFLPLGPETNNFLWRAANVASFAAIKLFIINSIHGLQDKVLQEYVPDLDAEEEIANASLVFINCDEHVEIPRPISHKFVYIGGFALSSPKPLQEPYKSFVNSAEHGVVLVSFGSVASSAEMTPQVKQSFVEMFKSFPHLKFIWKYERPEDNVTVGLENVLVSKWVPQTDLFSNKNVVAFITHGGMNSLSEASYHGIPMICVSLFGDQMRNCRTIEKRGIGVIVWKSEITKENLVNSLKTITEDQRIITAARTTTTLIKNKPFPPHERVLQYTEYAAKFDVGPNLDIQGRHLNFIQFYNIDVYLTFLFLFTVIPYYVVKLFIKGVIYSCCYANKRKVKAE